MSSKTVELTLVGFAALAVFLTIKSLMQKDKQSEVINTQYVPAWEGQGQTLYV